MAAWLPHLGAGCASDAGGGDNQGDGSFLPTAGSAAAGGAGGVAVPNAGTGAGAGGSTGVGMPMPGGAGAGGMAGTVGGGGSGAGGAVAGASGAGAGAAGGAAGSPPLDGPAPTLPMIAGECPEFTDGTIMVAGHGGVAITAGAPGMGGPLLFYWHGTGGSAMEASRTLPAAVRTEIISAGGIIASFNGDDSAGTEGDCSGTGAHNMADFLATDQIAACAVRDHGIDPRRIYTTGCSAGGLQAGCMAMKRSSYLAAAAPNSGGIVFPQQWQDMHTPAIFTMHGGSSDMVIVTFSNTSRTLDQAAKDHGGFVVNCDHGGGHCRAPADLQTAAWQFMKDHPWGFTASPWATAIPASVPSYCMVF